MILLQAVLTKQHEGGIKGMAVLEAWRSGHSWWTSGLIKMRSGFRQYGLELGEERPGMAVEPGGSKILNQREHQERALGQKTFLCWKSRSETEPWLCLRVPENSLTATGCHKTNLHILQLVSVSSWWRCVFIWKLSRSCFDPRPASKILRNQLVHLFLKPNQFLKPPALL